MRRVYDHVLVIVIAVLASSLTAGCTGDGGSGPATAAQCEALRDHVIELGLPATNDDPARRAEANKHIANLRRVLGSEFLEDCRRSHTTASVECALEATSKADVEHCRTDS